MKGVVFTEFMEMVEGQFGEKMMEEVIDEAGVHGVYTSIGTYPHSDMVNLVVALSKKSGVGIPDLLRAFGEYLFNSFTRMYPSFFESVDNSLDFLEQVEGVIHADVRKIYPKAQLPRFVINRRNEKKLEMIYYSERKMAELAVGLIRGCFDFFKQDGKVQIVDSAHDDTVVTLLIEVQ